MKNKKSKRNWGNIIVMSALALLVIFLIVKFIPNEPHFNITKEECWNETGFEFYCGNETAGMKMWAYGIKLNNTDLLLINLLLNDEDYQDCELTTLPSCEQVEVDYLFVFHTGKAYYEKNLTIEWLDENCECKDYTNDFYKNLICQKYKCEFEETYFVEIEK